MPRGRLIFPFTVRLAQLDTEATAADPDGAGPLTSGYDDDFREPVRVTQSTTDPAGDLKGIANRVEKFVDVRAQIETEVFEQLQQVIGGASPGSRFVIVLHYKDLEDSDMIGEDGQATIRHNDRLDRIIDGCENEFVFRNPPGLFVTQVMPGGFGLGPNRNLLIVTFEERDQGVASAAR